MSPEAARSISPVPVRTMVPGSRVRLCEEPATIDKGSGLAVSAPATNRKVEDALWVRAKDSPGTV
jgi:hypothetical protein